MPLVRANYALDGKVTFMDFVGEFAEREFYTWLAETAGERDEFQYLGRHMINRPIAWEYTAKGFAFWNGLLRIGKPDKVLTAMEEIDWVVEYLGLDGKNLTVGMNDICENPGWFELQSFVEDDLIAVTMEVDEEEETGMTEFESWLRTFIDEKDLPVEEWSYDKEGYIAIVVDNYDAVELIIEKMTAEEQEKVRKTLVQLDFLNGNINHFLKHIMDGYMEMI